MDLRIQRTKASIRSAFLELRQDKPIEKITVKELCVLAGINKATFYLHYSDIYSLADEIEYSLIDDLILSVDKDFSEDPKGYTDALFQAFMESRGRLAAVFSGSRNSLFAAKIEQRIKAKLYESNPDFCTPRNDTTISFLIQGMFHTVAACDDDEVDEKFMVISQLAELIVDRLEH